MITLHRLNGQVITVNAELIETIESTPDTIIRLVNGHRYIVAETMEQVVELVVEYRGRAGIPFFLREELLSRIQENEESR
jgi:flagellar protein FlbD